MLSMETSTPAADEPALTYQHPKETSTVMPFAYHRTHTFKPSTPTIGTRQSPDQTHDASRPHPFRKCSNGRCNTIYKLGIRTLTAGRRIGPMDRAWRCLHPRCTAWQHVDCYNQGIKQLHQFPGMGSCSGDGAIYNVPETEIHVPGRERAFVPAFGVVVVGPKGDCRKRFVVRANRFVDWREEENEERTKGYVVQYSGAHSRLIPVRAKPLVWTD